MNYKEDRETWSGLKIAGVVEADSYSKGAHIVIHPKVFSDGIIIYVLQFG
jgi:hypothetical protein